MHGLAVFLGLTNGAGHAYLAWSGVGSDVGELTIVAAVIGLYRRHSCHARKCWRLGKHAVSGTPYVTCARHHPVHPGSKALTAQGIANAHALAEQNEVGP